MRFVGQTVSMSYEGIMTEKIIELKQYRKAKADYQKLVDNNPHTILTFEDYFKVKTFLERVHKAKLKKNQESPSE